jgi:methylenetetrahydrofolate reductase (NADPH)
VISELGLPVRADQILVHLNSFHSREHLDDILKRLIEMGVTTLLVVTGDGGERLSKLAPEAIGANGKSVTSVDLLKFLHREHPGRFICGVAFNPYEPQDHELEKMRRKVEAGASFVITQPILGRHDALESLRQFNVPVILDAWMSKKLHLLSQCVGYEISENTAYDPLANLAELRKNYPDFGLYLALLGFKTQLPLLEKILNP